MSTQRTYEIEQILSVHTQLWEGQDMITYKDQLAPSHFSSDQGYRSVHLNNSQGTPHMWLTQNLSKSTYGTYSIRRASELGERLRITWIIRTIDNTYRYTGRIETHEYFDEHRPDRIHIETYSGNDVNVVYSTNEVYASEKSIL